MPKFDWRVAGAYLTLGAVLLGITLWFTWDLAAQDAEQRVRSERSAERHIEYAQDRIERKCFGLEGVALRDCVREQIHSAYDHARANQDLQAQQDMAFFTRVMGFTAVAGVVLGIGSVGLIFWTLRATQDMARDTRKIGEAQVRAYLRCFKVICKPNGKNATQDIFNLTVETENLGQSPARNIRVIVGIELLRFDGTRVAPPWQINAPTDPAMPPRGAATVSLSFGYQHGAADLVRQSNAYLRFTVAYVYEDVFGETTEFITYHHTEGSLLDSGITAAHIVTMKPEHRPK